MIFSKSCKIGIKAVSYLASQKDLNLHHSIIEIAETINESEHTLGKILQSLVKFKVIRSSKGPSGGFYMEAQKLELPLVNILEAIEGKFSFNACVLGYDKCSAKNPCALHTEFKKARAETEKILRKTKIGNLNISHISAN